MLPTDPLDPPEIPMTKEEMLREVRGPTKTILGGMLATVLALIGVGVQMGRFINSQERSEATQAELVTTVGSMEVRLRAVETSVAILLDRKESSVK